MISKQHDTIQPHTFDLLEVEVLVVLRRVEVPALLTNDLIGKVIPGINVALRQSTSHTKPGLPFQSTQMGISKTVHCILLQGIMNTHSDKKPHRKALIHKS